MKKKAFWIITVLLVFNFITLTLLFGKGVWITKINDTKISLKDFNESYKGVIIFGTMNSPIPLSKADFNKILKDKEKRLLFLRSFEDDHLIIKKAKEKKMFNEKKIDKEVKIIAELLKRQLIKREFYDKFIFPKIKTNSKEINKIYKKQKKDFAGISPSDAKKIIINQIKARKARIKFKEYSEKLRLESIIIHNESLL